MTPAVRLAAASVVSVVASCRPSHHHPITVGAAISLKESMDALAADFESTHHDKLDLVFGASGDLASQMRRGAPFDVLATAGEEPTLGATADAHCTLARNTVVLVRHRPAPGSTPPALSWESLGATPASFRLAIGLTPQVPAGVYAEQALRALGVWEAVLSRVVRGTNVRHVLDLVARGEADAGIVYATDVPIRPDVEVVAPVPERARPKVTYPLYLARGASAESRAVADYLCSAQAARILTAHGFLPP